METLTIEFILGCWIIFGIVWLVASFATKRTIERQGFQWRLFEVGIAVVVFVLLKSGTAFSAFMGTTVWTQTLTIRLIADAITFSGLLVTLWARATLGGNWSSEVAFKENHELIERGPYRFVRHPIYSGLLLMFLGTALMFDRIGGFVVITIIVIGFWYKARQEEKLLTRHFAEAYPEYRARVKALIPFLF